MIPLGLQLAAVIIGGLICGAIVYNDHFQQRAACLVHAFQRLAQEMALVVTRNNNRYPGVHFYKSGDTQLLGLIIVQDFNDSTVRRAKPVFAGSRLKMHRHALGPFL